MKQRRLYWVGLCFLVLVWQPVFAQEAKQLFEQGIEASKKQDYPKAIQYFLQAKKQGYKSPAVDYNLGAAYYKLENYAKAKEVYSRLLKIPEFEQLAAFNLGLVANKRKHEKEAIDWFQRAYASGENEHITSLAAEALRRLGAEPLQEKAKAAATDDWSGFVYLAWADDSNVSLANEDLAGVTSERDSSLELMVAANYWIRGNRDDGLQLGLSLLEQEYSSLDQYDFRQLHADLARYGRIGKWQLRFRGAWNESYFGGDNYQRVLMAEARGRYALSQQRELRLRYRMNKMEATSAQYDYLDGWQHQFRIGTRLNSGERSYTTYYQLDSNERTGVDSATDTTSYSPTRHTLRHTTQLSLNPQWDAKLDAQYRFSQYEDDHVVNVDLGKKRQDNRLRLGLTLSREFAKDWEFEAGYSYTKNDSNVDAYSYDRSVINAGVNWYF